MREPPFRDAASATSYHGFSTAPPSQAGAPVAPARGRLLRAILTALLPLAASAAMVWIVVAGPRHRQLSEAGVPASTAAPPVVVQAEPVAPQPVAASSPAPPAATDLGQETATTRAAAAPPPRAARVATVAHRQPPVRTASTPQRPAFHCDWRLRRSERMICNSAPLAQLDRELNHAYEAAILAGADRTDLRRAQDAWVFRREKVARRGERALMQDYRRRIAQLEALAGHPKHGRRRH